jgi:hypothetical protein
VGEAKIPREQPGRGENSGAHPVSVHSTAGASRRARKREGGMKQWSFEDERPYLRPRRSFYPWIVGALALVLAAAVGYYYYYFQPKDPQVSSPVTQPPTAPQADAPAAPARP